MSKNEYGWNDPPRFSYQEGLKSDTRKATSLNKRPSYPADHLRTEQKTRPVEDTHLPPLIGNAKLHTSPTNLPPPPASSTTTTTPTADKRPISNDVPPPQGELLDKQNILDYFNSMMEDRRGILSEKQLEEVSKRMGLLSRQWEEGRISDTVHRKLSDLVTAIRKNDDSLVEKIHIGLMVDHVNEVSQWMVGIKRLIKTKV